MSRDFPGRFFDRQSSWPHGYGAVTPWDDFIGGPPFRRSGGHPMSMHPFFEDFARETQPPYFARRWGPSTEASRKTDEGGPGVPTGSSAPAAGSNSRSLAPRWPDFGFDRQVSEVQDTDEKFAVKLDVSQYAPTEVEVKVQGNEVVVRGEHEERQDEHGFVSRQFQRRYILPENVKTEHVASKLSKEGFLTVEAPKANAVTGERKIPIEHVG